MTWVGPKCNQVVLRGGGRGRLCDDPGGGQLKTGQRFEDAGLEDGSHVATNQPRNATTSQKPEESGRHCSPADTLTMAHWD